MDQFLQHLLNALILGGTYALLGIGLTLIFGIMRVVNFAHGELYAFGAYMMYLWVMVLGANFYLALPLAVLLGVALGALIELVLLRRLQGADIDTTMLVMIGAWIALQNTEQLTWSGVAKSINAPFPSGFDSYPAPYQVATAFFAVIDLVAGVGLWLAAPWGAVVWLTSVISMAAVEVLFPQIFGGSMWVVAVEVVLLCMYLWLALMAAREQPA